jgi:glycosyltransferase involved in cell wall biosynthesis
MTAGARMRVLYVVDKLHRAGTQVHLQRLVGGLDRAAFDPRVCCLMAGGPIAESLHASGVPVEVLGLPNIYGPAAARGLVRLARSCRRERVDLVHAYLVSANIYATVAARLARVPAVVTARRDTGFSRNWRLRAVEEWVINPLVDRVTAVSPAAAAAARRERGLGHGKVVTIPNGLDLAEWDTARHPRADARREWRLAPDETAVAAVGSLSPVKGHVDLLQAAARVLATRPRVRFFVVGDGPLRAELTALAASLGIAERVVFTGVRDDVARLLSMADVVVLPSHTEGMSNALLEAMAMARAVVATAAGGNVDVLEDGLSGLLVPPRDPATLAAALQRLVDRPYERHALGACARRRIEERYSLPVMLAEHERLYRSLLRR